MAVVNGTNSSEVINGTAEDDILTGGAGNDTLLGGPGEDTAIYSGNSADYRFGWNGGRMTITDTSSADGNDGTDSFQDIEKIQFADKSFTVNSGGIIAVNTTTYGFQGNPSVAVLVDGGWITVWQSSGSGPESEGEARGIFAQRYDANGKAIGSEIQISTDTSTFQMEPSVSALPDGGWVVAWATEEILSRRYDADGEPTGDVYPVNTTSLDSANHSSVTSLVDGGWLVSWEDNNQVFSQRYDSSGDPSGAEIQVSSAPMSQDSTSSTALADGGWLVSWFAQQNSGPFVVGQTAMQRYSAFGEPIGTAIYGSAQMQTQGQPSIAALADGGWLMAWVDSESKVSYQRYSPAGEKLGSPTQLDLTSQTSDTSISVVNLTGGGWLITSGTHPFESIRFDSNGNQIAHIPTPPNSDSEITNLGAAALPDGGWLLTWQRDSQTLEGTDTFSLRYSADGVPQIPTIHGTAGNDTLSGQYSIALAGGLGDDLYILDASGTHPAFIQEKPGEGTDTIYSSSLNYTLADHIEIGRIVTSAETAWLTGNGLDNTLFAANKKQYLTGGNGSDTASYVYSTTGVTQALGDNIQGWGDGSLYSIENIIGSNFNDTFLNKSGNNTLNGGQGHDTVNYSLTLNSVTINLAIAGPQNTQGAGSDTFISIENITGSNYNDTLIGNSANNTLYGGLGNDTLNGGAGVDTLIGSDGSDTYYVDNASDVVSETNSTASTGGTDSVYSSLTGYTMGNNIENGLILSTGSANLTGNSLNNVLYAGSGNNILNGGSGTDTASYLYASRAITASLASTSAQATGGSGSDTLSAIENLSGSAYNDSLTGNSANNKLSGGSGNDALNGGAGTDNMIGGDGSDSFYVDNTGDVVSETNADNSTGGTDTVHSYLAAYNLGTNIENGRILATGSANLTGNNLNNVLMAGNGNNVLNGGSGTDTASYTYAGSAITVNLSNTSAQVTLGSGSDTLIAIENLVGSNYNDTLTGNFANNKLNGGSGNDRLTGGAGKDTLIGGAGNDIFAFSALADSGLTSDGWDIIKDFVRGSDKVDLSKLDANSATSGDNAFTQIINGAAAFTAAGQLKVLNDVLYGNTDGDIDAEFAIQLIGVSSVSLADFIA